MQAQVQAEAQVQLQRLAAVSNPEWREWQTANGNWLSQA